MVWTSFNTVSGQLSVVNLYSQDTSVSFSIRICITGC